MPRNPFLSQYIETALWSSSHTTEDGQDVPMDSMDTTLAPELLATMEADCKAFEAAHAADLETHDDPTMGAHDFWLTRNGHGVGFWDGDWPEPQAERLTEACEALGGFDLYVGDDGLIYGCKS